ncbi:MAG TPA: hypothetical protein VK612_03255 [Pyrinomonadaceae bacterium]|nr:hypothetical protein [Pyrinomonadaceae bacterium]
MYFAFRSARQAERNLALQEVAASRNDKRLEIDYQLQIQDWVTQVIRAMSDAYVLGEFQDDNDFERRRIEAMASLTSLLDQGRMFFPNIDADWGKEKPIAFQGLRHEILDPIKKSFDLVKRMKELKTGQRESMAELFFKRRQEFVSIAHKELSPKDRDQFFKTLSGNKFKSK